MTLSSLENLARAMGKLRSAVHLWGISLRKRRAMWTRIGLGLVAVLCIVVSAWADFVSGRVFGPDGKTLPNATFTAENGGKRVTFRTDNSGNFSVYLEPGTYTVHANADETVNGV